MKPQLVRLLDVFVIGPLMVSVAARAQGVPDWQRVALAIFGLATIGYNAKNYLAARRR